MATPKLPKDIIMMIEKNNTVMAIKTLASDRDISMAEAKIQVDAYEEALIADRQKQLAKIAKKQGISQDSKTRNTENKNLSDSVNAHLSNIGYKKPSFPYWLKRVTMIMVVMTIVFWVLWRQFS